MKTTLLLFISTLITLPALGSQKACKKATILRSLASIDREGLPKAERKEIRQLQRLVCANINPKKDIYYKNGVKAYSKKAKDWFYPSDKFALLANGEGDVKYPNDIKAYSKKAKDWFYPSNVLAFLDIALKPGKKHPLYYPNKVKAFSEKKLDWYYPSDKMAFLDKALGRKGNADMFYPNGVKAYSKRKKDWHNPDDQFVFDDFGDNKLRTLFDLSGARTPNFSLKGLRKLRITLFLDRIDRQF